MSDLADFRARVRAWIAERYPPRPDEYDDERRDTVQRETVPFSQSVQLACELQAGLFDAGFAGMRVPVEYGGQGLTAEHDQVVTEELFEFLTPSRRPMGIGPTLALPTLLNAGTAEQKRRHVRGILRADELWCQLFSEPDAGSDLASLRTRAVADGDQFVVNGQKVWSSFAADAHYGLLLARTDPSAPKPQMGITMFILPMETPGVKVRPLVDIAGGHHFNEVFLEDVAVSAGNVIGTVHRGWDVANGTLGGERATYMGGSGDGRRRRQVVDAARLHGRIGDPCTRQAIAAVIGEERILELLRDRVEGGQVYGGHPAAGSLMKMAAGNLEQAVSELLIDIAGPAGLAWPSDDPDGSRAAHGLNASRQATIAGGTHQIQRNLLGERLLGLPR